MPGSADRLLAAVLAGNPVQPGQHPGAGRRRVFVAGICKNAGKTVTLSALLAAGCRRGLSLALASTGRDGEEKDAVTNLPKPRIHAPAGTWIATVSGALGISSARMAVARELNIHTPLGPVVIARVTGAGGVVLVGAGSRQRLGAVLAELTAAAGSGGLLLLDGSFDRIAAAQPGMSDILVLAAGAAYSQTMARTVARAGQLADVFGLGPVPSPLAPAAQQALAAHAVAWVDGRGVQPLPVASGLVNPNGIADWLQSYLSTDAGCTNGAGPAGVLAIAGAVAGGLVKALTERRLANPAGACSLASRVALAVPDPTHVLAETQVWRHFRRLGGLAYTLRPVRLAAITCNPYSPTGPDYDPQVFMARMAAALPHLPVYDLVAGLAALPKGGPG